MEAVFKIEKMTIQSDQQNCQNATKHGQETILEQNNNGSHSRYVQRLTQNKITKIYKTKY